MSDPLAKLQAQRAKLLARLAQIGDMRRGSITETYRRCGKQSCHCAAPQEPGHGPFYAFTVKVQGKTKTLQLRPGPQLAKIAQEVENYRAFRATCEELWEVSERICEARPVEESDQGFDLAGWKKKLRRRSRQRSHGKSSG